MRQYVTNMHMIVDMFFGYGLNLVINLIDYSLTVGYWLMLRPFRILEVK